MPGNKFLTRPYKDSDRSLTYWMRDTSEDEDFAGWASRLDELIDYLPRADQEVLDFRLRGVSQREIGRVYGVTQAAISHRLKRITRRLIWLAKRPKRPDSFLSDLGLALEGRVNSPLIRKFGVKAVAHFADRTCQSEAARAFGISQGRLRGWILLALDYLAQLGLDRSHAYLSYTMHGLKMLHDEVHPTSLRPLASRRS